MSLLVQKFGGTSLKDYDSIRRCALHVKKEIAKGHQVVVVVSAMAGVTNKLIEHIQMLSEGTGDFAEEYDTIVSSGEAVSCGLMAVALKKLGLEAKTFLGWQVPIESDDVHSKARIKKVESKVLQEELEQNHIPVVAGFQGVTKNNRLTTFGRGGSDTTAVALAVALKADRCDIYTDVEGVYTADPRIVSRAKKLEKVSYEAMLELASLGSKVLEPRSVEMAGRYKVPLQVLTSFDQKSGTFVVERSKLVEEEIVGSISYCPKVVRIKLQDVEDKAGVSYKALAPLIREGISLDMISSSDSKELGAALLSFVVSQEDSNKARSLLLQHREKVGFSELKFEEQFVRVSVVGVGLLSNSWVIEKMLHFFSEKGINMGELLTSETKISVLIPEEYGELAVRGLHQIYNLESNEQEKVA